MTLVGVHGTGCTRLMHLRRRVIGKKPLNSQWKQEKKAVVPKATKHKLLPHSDGLSMSASVAHKALTYTPHSPSPSSSTRIGKTKHATHTHDSLTSVEDEESEGSLDASTIHRHTADDNDTSPSAGVQQAKDQQPPTGKQHSSSTENGAGGGAGALAPASLQAASPQTMTLTADKNKTSK
uniref:Uncharacterized protein n=1 Tax=Anopheles merus TaxID=30066 RepID=A0A182V391_ANOME